MEGQNRRVPGEGMAARVEKRMVRRPQLGFTPAFYARLGLEDPWVPTDPVGGADRALDMVYLSIRPYQRHMMKLATARRRREQRLARFLSEHGSVRLRAVERRQVGEIGAAPSFSLASAIGSADMVFPTPIGQGTPIEQPATEVTAAPAPRRRPTVSPVRVRMASPVRPFVPARVAARPTPRVDALRAPSASEAAPLRSPIETPVRARRAAAAAPRPAERVGLRLAAAGVADSPLVRAVRQAVEQRVAPTRVLELVERLEQASPTEVVRVVRQIVRVMGPQGRILEEQVERALPDAVVGASSVARGRAASRSAGVVRGLRGALSSAPSMAMLQPVTEAPAAEAAVEATSPSRRVAAPSVGPRRVRRVAAAAHLRSRAPESYSLTRSPIVRAPARPASLSANPVARAPRAPRAPRPARAAVSATPSSAASRRAAEEPARPAARRAPSVLDFGGDAPVASARPVEPRAAATRARAPIASVRPTLSSRPVARPQADERVEDSFSPLPAPVASRSTGLVAARLMAAVAQEQGFAEVEAPERLLAVARRVERIAPHAPIRTRTGGFAPAQVLMSPPPAAPAATPEAEAPAAAAPVKRLRLEAASRSGASRKGPRARGTWVEVVEAAAPDLRAAAPAPVAAGPAPLRERLPTLRRPAGREVNSLVEQDASAELVADVAVQSARTRGSLARRATARSVVGEPRRRSGLPQVVGERRLTPLHAAPVAEATAEVPVRRASARAESAEASPRSLLPRVGVAQRSARPSFEGSVLVAPRAAEAAPSAPDAVSRVKVAARSERLEPTAESPSLAARVGARAAVPSPTGRSAERPTLRAEASAIAAPTSRRARIQAPETVALSPVAPAVADPSAAPAASPTRIAPRRLSPVRQARARLHNAAPPPVQGAQVSVVPFAAPRLAPVSRRPARWSWSVTPPAVAEGVRSRPEPRSRLVADAPSSALIGPASAVSVSPMPASLAERSATPRRLTVAGPSARPEPAAAAPAVLRRPRVRTLHVPSSVFAEGRGSRVPLVGMLAQQAASPVSAEVREAIVALAARRSRPGPATYTRLAGNTRVEVVFADAPSAAPAAESQAPAAAAPGRRVASALPSVGAAPASRAASVAAPARVARVRSAVSRAIRAGSPLTWATVRTLQGLTDVSPGQPLWLPGSAAAAPSLNSALTERVEAVTSAAGPASTPVRAARLGADAPVASVVSPASMLSQPEAIPGAPAAPSRGPRRLRQPAGRGRYLSRSPEGRFVPRASAGPRPAAMAGPAQVLPQAPGLDVAVDPTAHSAETARLSRWTGQGQVVQRANGGPRGAGGLDHTLDAVERGEIDGALPVWARRSAGEPLVRGSGGDLIAALAKADAPEEIIRVIVERGASLGAVAAVLPRPMLQVIEHIRAEAQAERLLDEAGGGEAADLAGSTLRQAAAPSAGGNSGGGGFSRSSVRVVRGFTNLGRGAKAQDGLGMNKMTKLARKLQDLILLAENQQRDAARRQVRMAEDSVSARSEGQGSPAAPGASGNRQIDLEALFHEVLEGAMREMELRRERRQEEGDERNVWW